jgi:hypothetical protein
MRAEYVYVKGTKIMCITHTILILNLILVIINYKPPTNTGGFLL